MSIKSAHVVKHVVCAVKVDRLLADLEVGAANPDEVKAVLREVRRSFDVPATSYLNDDEQAELIIAAIQSSDNPLIVARQQMSQDFFANVSLSAAVRKRVASFLVKTFGDRGNPMWQSYLNGTFRYVDVQSLDE